MVLTSNASFIWVTVLFASLYVIQVAESAFMLIIQLSKIVPGSRYVILIFQES